MKFMGILMQILTTSVRLDYSENSLSLTVSLICRFFLSLRIQYTNTLSSRCWLVGRIFRRMFISVSWSCTPDSAHYPLTLMLGNLNNVILIILIPYHTNLFQFRYSFLDAELERCGWDTATCLKSLVTLTDLIVWYQF